MKKTLLALMAAASFATTAKAQLADGSLFPNFTTVDYKGNPIDLYTILNSGKTVFIDISATWCAPCWAYHNTGALDSIWAKHGPAGQAGVDLGTTDDAYVIFVQGETGSGIAELTFNGIGFGAQNTTFNHTNFTQGDWTAGVKYPIIDDSTMQGARNTLWNIAYFPTVYMICRDHLSYELTQPTEAQAYTALKAGCPTYAPTASTDVKATIYTGAGSFNCSATPTISFQNYSTAPLTSATIKVTDGTGATVHTEPWTGSLASLAVTSVTLSSFTGTTFQGYKFSVTSTGDINTANDVSADSIFKVYGPGNASTVPMTEDFETATNFYKYYLPDPKGYTILSSSLTDPANTSASKDIIGTSGSKSNVVWFDNYDATNASPAVTGYATSFMFGNYNIASNTNLAFDVCYSAKTGVTATDKLDVMVSTDCGSTWTSAWSASGTTLATTTSTSTNWFIPSAATQWKNQVVSLNTYKNSNLMIKFQSTTASASGNGELLYVDNINFKLVTGIPEVVANNDIKVYPNPAKDFANVSLTLNEAAKVSVQLIDVVGRTINTITKDLNAGEQNIELSTAGLSSGLYTVKISAGETITTKQLSVVK